MINIKFALRNLLLVINILPIIVLARVREYETTRLKSTAGAGVGSILLNESAILNPASVAYFNMSSVQVQMEKQAITSQDQDRRPLTDQWSRSSQNMAIIAADSKRQVKGTSSIVKQEESFDRRQRMSISIGAPMKKTSAIGFIFNQTKDQNLGDGKTYEDKYYQLIFGATHVIDQNLSIGVVFKDLFKARPDDTKIILGGQYVMKNILTIIFDMESNYYQNIQDTLTFRGALQVNILSDLYLRAGYFKDNLLKESGTGIGASWVTPKLSFDLAIKTTRAFDAKYSKLQRGETLRETSASVAYLF